MFTPCGLGGLVCQTRHIRLIVRKVSINGSCWVPIFLLLFFFLLILLNLSVGDVTTVLFEVVELITHRTKALLGEKNYVAWESGTGQRRSGLPSVEGLLLATAPQIQQGRERTESQIPFFENLPLSWSRLDKLLSVGQVLSQKKRQQIGFQTCRWSCRPSEAVWGSRWWVRTCFLPHKTTEAVLSVHLQTDLEQSLGILKP